MGRYAGIDLSSPLIDDVLAMFQTGGGSIQIGGQHWEYAASGLGSNTVNASGFSNGRYYIVLDASGGDVFSVPEPSKSLLTLIGTELLAFTRRRKA